MIERQKIDGRDAIVSYLGEDFQPWPDRDSPMVKVQFVDGPMIILRNSQARRKPRAVRKQR